MEENVAVALVSTLVPLFFFGFLALVVVVPRVLRSRERLAVIETARKALEHGQGLPPELLEALQADVRPPTASRELRHGAILLAVALAIVVCAFVFASSEGAIEVIYPFMGFAAFPGFIGLVHLAFWAANRNKPSA